MHAKIGDKIYFFNKEILKRNGLTPSELSGGCVTSYKRLVAHKIIRERKIDKWLLIEKTYKGGVLLVGFDSSKQFLPCSDDPLEAIAYELIIMREGFAKAREVEQVLRYNRSKKRVRLLTIAKNGVIRVWRG